MSTFDVVGPLMAEFVNDRVQKTWRLISEAKGTRFIVCGASGSGKTRAIDLANGLLPEDEQIAESGEILWQRDAAVAATTIDQVGLAYENSLHIAFSTVDVGLAKTLEAQGFKVFWLGATGSSSRSGGTQPNQ
jgi:energy-coupling factor transporter ATP-binding protein EcfA2